MKTGIYLVTCLETGNQYVGQSIDIDDRWSEHRTHLSHGRHRSQLWQDEWRTYGSDAFTWEVLEEVADRRALDARVRHYLQGLQPAYNLSETNPNSQRQQPRTAPDDLAAYPDVTAWVMAHPPVRDVAAYRWLLHRLFDGGPVLDEQSPDSDKQ